MFIDVAQIHLDLMKYSMYRYELGSWNIYDVRLVHFATTNVNFSRVFFSGRGKEGGGGLACKQKFALSSLKRG